MRLKKTEEIYTFYPHLLFDLTVWWWAHRWRDTYNGVAV